MFKAFEKADYIFITFSKEFSQRRRRHLRLHRHHVLLRCVPGCGPISYTHLDVYKRQTNRRNTGCKSELFLKKRKIFFRGGEAVMEQWEDELLWDEDVYKRQEQFHFQSRVKM